MELQEAEDSAQGSFSAASPAGVENGPSGSRRPPHERAPAAAAHQQRPAEAAAAPVHASAAAPVRRPQQHGATGRLATQAATLREMVRLPLRALSALCRSCAAVTR